MYVMLTFSLIAILGMVSMIVQSYAFCLRGEFNYMGMCLKSGMFMLIVKGSLNKVLCEGHSMQVLTHLKEGDAFYHGVICLVYSWFSTSIEILHINGSFGCSF